MQNRITSSGTVADSEQKDENIVVSQHSSKPHVRRSCFYSVDKCRYEWQGVSCVWASKLFCKVGFVSGFVCLANVLALAWVIRWSNKNRND